MSKAFTAPAGATWQSLLNEITNAYSERRQAIGQTAYVPEERIVQSAAYWAGLQSWLETYCTSFIDHDNGPLTDAGDAFLYFTLDNWRATAGIHQDGFRRVTESGASTHGQMQIGDAIGPWIFEDLQKGFGALKWRAKQWFADYPIPAHRGLLLSDDPWSSTTWSTTAWIQWPIYYASANTIRLQWRVRGRARVEINLPTPWSCSFYGLPQCESYQTFFDIDGYEMINGRLYLISDAPADSSAVKYSAMLGNSEVEPFSVTPNGTVFIASLMGGYGDSAIIKPEFTNT